MNGSTEKQMDNSPDADDVQMDYSPEVEDFHVEVPEKEPTADKTDTGDHLKKFEVVEGAQVNIVSSDNEKFDMEFEFQQEVGKLERKVLL